MDMGNRDRRDVPIGQPKRGNQKVPRNHGFTTKCVAALEPASAPKIPAKTAVTSYSPGFWFTTMLHVATPEASVVPLQLCDLRVNWTVPLAKASPLPRSVRRALNCAEC